MFDPVELIATPPRAPVMPANRLPKAAGVRSFVIGGENKVALQAILACPAAKPLIWRVP